MLIKKLKTMFGIPLDDVGKLYEEKKRKISENSSFIVPNNINPIDYLKIPETNFCIVKIEEDWMKGFDYETSHRKVLEKGLQVPTPALFTAHLRNIINAYHNNTDVYQADENKISREELEDIYKHLTTDHIKGGAWTWLNGKFVSGSGFNNLDLETITGIDSNGNLTTKKEPLEKCLMKDCYVDLKFNKQGLAIEKSKERKYIKGKSICYLHPRENYIARFYSGSCWSFLDCSWYPFYSSALFGVFASAEGAS